jgi:hypothetical protein
MSSLNRRFRVKADTIGSGYRPPEPYSFPVFERCSECLLWEEDCLCMELGHDYRSCRKNWCDICDGDYFYDERCYELFQWVEEVRPWVMHGGNPLMDLMEGLEMPEHERPAHQWTRDAVLDAFPFCHCDCSCDLGCDLHNVGGTIFDWYDWAEELASRRNNPLHKLYEALTPTMEA